MGFTIFFLSVQICFNHFFAVAIQRSSDRSYSIFKKNCPDRVWFEKNIAKKI